jgi:alpha-tubulin suppressor-like RCC1 family protein
MAFISGPDGDLKTAFVSDAWLLDQFVGNNLFNWGDNSYGKLGDNTAPAGNSTVANKSNPVQTVAGGINWKQVACGGFDTAAIKTDGTLWCWGYNWTGSSGDNTIIHRSSPVQTITLGTNWKQVSVGNLFTAAIKTDGTLWCWGDNQYGALGDNTVVNKSSPVQTVTGGTNWKQVSAGYGCTAAIKTDGTLWVWGQNNYLQLGDNSATSRRSSPVQTAAFGTNWKQVSAGVYNMAAIKTDGTLWCWGYGGYGANGNNDNTSPRSSPVQTVAGGTNWKQVSCNTHVAAIKTDGTLWTWGNNSNGQLGDNTITNRSSPVQTITLGTNWKQVSCGTLTTAAIKNDGTLWLWGKNAYGQIGDNTRTDRSSPVQTTAYGNNWKQVSNGTFRAAAVTNGDI